MLSLFAPILVSVLNIIIQKFFEKTELQKAWLQFIDIASKEGLVSVRLSNDAAAQRERLKNGQWQKPGEDFSTTPPPAITPKKDMPASIQTPDVAIVGTEFTVLVEGLPEGTPSAALFAERTYPLGFARLDTDGNFRAKVKFTSEGSGKRTVGFQLNGVWVEKIISVKKV